MIKFKDLYVSLESETPAQGGTPTGFGCWLNAAGGWGFGPNCANNETPSQSTFVCETVPTFVWAANVWAMLQGYPGAGGANAPQMPLKEYLRTALAKAVPEPKPVDELSELERLEDKLSGALEEVRARKAQIREARHKSDSR
jgi:hypothetical protein